MKKKFLYLWAVAVVVLGGCTGAYKSSQTPDDVYYSPTKGGIGAAGEYDDYAASSDDRYLRMKVRDHYRWSGLDDYAYWNDSRYFFNDYGYGAGSFYNPGFYNGGFYNNHWVNNYYGAFGYGNPYYYNPYAGWYGFYGSNWNSWYNPYYTVIYYKNPETHRTLSQGSNLSAYGNRNYNNSNQLYRPAAKGSSSNYNNSNNFGGLVRKAFSGSNNSNNSGNSSGNWQQSNPSRTFSPGSPAPSSSAGGRSGGYNSSNGSSGARPSRN
ncbi:hypothetical protein [Filimonas effusa]|uniref:Prolyl-tRNA synthetase n=1 Tax=Filimonas effusa TaxID=2508721 RepID=A0A4Q1D873_9BACT|nr:hypothetical protein [Filimonas effusa]RXK85461.1 hypothetical protein ESB13_01155 [Filimonas effusa]